MTDLTPFDFLDQDRGMRTLAEASSGGGGEQTVSVTLTADQLRHLNSAPPELVPAQGPGTVIVPASLLLRLNYGTQAFDVSTSVISYSTDMSNGVAVTGFLDGFLKNTETTLYVARLPEQPKESAVVNNVMVNKPLVLLDYDTDASQGDSTLDVFIAFQVFTLP
jgi:hypothetical protein